VVKIASLESLANAPAPLSTRFQNSSDEEKRVLGILLESTRQFQQGDETAALDTLLGTRALLHCVPLPIMANQIWLCRRLRREQVAAHECLAFARDAIDMGYEDLGLEACSAAMILDAQGQFEIIRDPSALASVAALYERVAQRPFGGDGSPRSGASSEFIPPRRDRPFSARS
jgi:hypothetical protein